MLELLTKIKKAGIMRNTGARAGTLSVGIFAVLFCSFAFSATPAYAIYVYYFTGTPQSVSPGQSSVLQFFCSEQDGADIYDQNNNLVALVGAQPAVYTTPPLYADTTYTGVCHDTRITNTVYASAVTTITINYTPPVFNSIGVSYNNSANTVKLYWNVTPSNRNTSTGLFAYGNTWNNTQMSGWVNSIGTAALTVGGDFYLGVVDTYYGTVWSAHVYAPNDGLTVDCGAPSSSTCGDTSGSAATNNHAIIAVGQTINIRGYFNPDSGGANAGAFNTARAIVSNVGAITNPDTGGSVARVDDSGTTLVYAFTPSSPGTYTFYTTMATNNFPWGSYAPLAGGYLQSATVTVNPVPTCTVTPSAATFINGTFPTLNYTTTGSPSNITFKDGANTISSINNPPASGSVTDPFATYGHHTISAMAQPTSVVCTAGANGLSFDIILAPSCTITPASTAYTTGANATINYTTSNSPTSITIKDGATTLQTINNPASSGSITESAVTTGTHTLSGSVQPNSVACSSGTFTAAPAPAPSVTFSSSMGNSMTVGQSTTLTATFSAGSGDSFTANGIADNTNNYLTASTPTSVTRFYSWTPSVPGSYLFSARGTTAVYNTTAQNYQSLTITVSYACSGASGGGASGTYPSCTCTNSGYVYGSAGNTCTAPLCTAAAGGGASGSYPSCTCNNSGYTYSAASNTCTAPLCSAATNGGATGTYPSCTCNNGGTYSSSGNTCTVSAPAAPTGTITANPSSGVSPVTSTLTWSVTPGPQTVSNSYLIYDVSKGFYAYASLPASGSVSSGALTSTDQFVLYAVDSYYGTYMLNSATVTVSTPTDLCSNFPGTQNPVPANCIQDMSGGVPTGTCSVPVGSTFDGTSCVQSIASGSISQFFASPSRVQKGKSTLLKWNTTGMVSCSVTNILGGAALSSALSSVGLSVTIYGKSTYTLTCMDQNGVQYSSNATVNIVPVTQEL